MMTLRQIRRLGPVVMCTFMLSVGCSDDGGESDWEIEDDVGVSDVATPDARVQDSGSADADVADVPPPSPSTLEQCNGTLPDTMSLGLDDGVFNVGNFTSRADYALGLGPTGCPRLGYAAEREGTIYFARWDGEEWVEDEVETNDGIGWMDYAFRDDGQMGVAYRTGDKLRYASRSADGQWRVEDVQASEELRNDDGEIDVGSFDLAFGPDGQPVIGVTRAQEDGLAYFERDGDGWRHEIASEQPAMVSYHLELSPDGRPYFLGGVYDEHQRQSVYLIQRDEESTTWTSQQVVAAADVQYAPGMAWLAFSGEADPRILYGNQESDGLWEFRRSATGWQRASQPTVAGMQVPSSEFPTDGPLLEGRSGRLHFFYIKDGDELHLATSDGDEWHSRFVRKWEMAADRYYIYDFKVAIDRRSRIAHVILMEVQPYESSGNSQPPKYGNYFHFSLE